MADLMKCGIGTQLYYVESRIPWSDSRLEELSKLDNAFIKICKIEILDISKKNNMYEWHDKLIEWIECKVKDIDTQEVFNKAYSLDMQASDLFMTKEEVIEEVKRLSSFIKKSRTEYYDRQIELSSNAIKKSEENIAKMEKNKASLDDRLEKYNNTLIDKINKSW